MARIGSPRRGGVPPGGRVLLGPFLTGRQLGRQIGAHPRWLCNQEYVLRIDGPVGPAYPAFQVADDRLRTDVCFMGLLLRRRVDDIAACDWWVRPVPDLGSVSPLVHLDAGRRIQPLIEALPEPTVDVPARSSTPDLDRARETWLRMRAESESPSWKIAWERIGRASRTYPLGI
jgi:hypothetical protein